MSTRAAGRNLGLRTFVRFAVLAIATFAGVVFSGLGTAQGTPGWNVHPSLQDTWNVQVGVYRPKVETSARLDSRAGRIGTSVSFEDDLGLSDSNTVPTLLASMRLGERGRIEAEYFSVHRDGMRTNSRTINWGENTFAVNTAIASSFDSDIYRLSVGYSFVKDAAGELGIALGLHATDFSVSLGAPSVGTQAGETLAPLPTIGLYGAYAFSPKWLVSGRLDYFSLNYGDYDGSLISVTGGVEYRVARHFGIGAGYRYVDYDLTVTKSRFTGNVNYKFYGPTLFAVATF